MKAKLMGLFAGAALLGMSSSSIAGELTGAVLRADSKTVYVDDRGAVVALKVDGKTRFDGIKVKKASDLKEGEQVSVSFSVKDNRENLATSISVTRGQGGSGSDTGVSATSGTRSDTKGSGSSTGVTEPIAKPPAK